MGLSEIHKEQWARFTCALISTCGFAPKNYLVADIIFGVELFYSNYFRIAASFVLRSSEFHDQDGWDRFGSINCSFEF
jgi:Uncharacterized protein conserved in bacteria (DUF2219)